MKGNKLAIGAIIGAAAGIVAGVLTAPKSGKETRDDIKRKASEAKDKVATHKDDIVFKAEEIADDVRIKASEAIETVTSTIGRK
jgi:gas vesicle protein